MCPQDRKIGKTRDDHAIRGRFPNKTCMNQQLQHTTKAKHDSKESVRACDDKSVQCELLMPPMEGWFKKMLNKIKMRVKRMMKKQNKKMADKSDVVKAIVEELGQSTGAAKTGNDIEKVASGSAASIPPPPPPMPPKVAGGYLKATVFPMVTVKVQKNELLLEIQGHKALKKTAEIHPRKAMVQQSSLLKLLEKRRLKIKATSELSFANNNDVEWSE